MGEFIYPDSCILIYLLEQNPIFGPIAAKAVAAHADNPFCYSPLIELECLVGPLKRKDQALQKRYTDFFRTLTCLEITPEIYRLAAELRADFGLKTPDALHLATVRHYGCGQLWTHDDRLWTAGKDVAVNILARF